MSLRAQVPECRLALALVRTLVPLTPLRQYPLPLTRVFCPLPPYSHNEEYGTDRPCQYSLIHATNARLVYTPYPLFTQ